MGGIANPPTTPTGNLIKTQCTHIHTHLEMQTRSWSRGALQPSTPIVEAMALPPSLPPLWSSGSPVLLRSSSSSNDDDQGRRNPEQEQSSRAGTEGRESTGTGTGRDREVYVVIVCVSDCAPSLRSWPSVGSFTPGDPHTSTSFCLAFVLPFFKYIFAAKGMVLHTWVLMKSPPPPKKEKSNTTSICMFIYIFISCLIFVDVVPYIYEEKRL